MNGQYIEIVDAATTFTFRPKAADGTPMAASFELQIIPDDVEKKARREATGKPTFERGVRIDNFDTHKFVNAMLDYAIVGWTGIRMRGVEVPCTAAHKLLLPEKWKQEINRLCLGKEAGEEIAAEAALDEKKL
jgi:hypothetical protein